MTRTSLLATLFFLLVCSLTYSTAVLAEETVGSGDSASPKKKTLRLAPLRPIYGPLGSKRSSSTCVAGEKVRFASKVQGFQVDAEGYTDIDYEYMITDLSGTIRFSRRDRMIIRSSKSNELPVQFSVDTRMSLAAGQYVFATIFHDKISGESVTERANLEVLDKSTFRLINLGLYYDSEGLHGSGGNMTVGEEIWVKCDARLPKNAENKVAVEIKLSVFDQNNVSLFGEKVYKYSKDNIFGNGIQVWYLHYVSISRPGKYRLHLEAVDPLSGKTDQHDLPLMVHEPPRVAGQPKAVIPHSKIGSRHTAATGAADASPAPVDGELSIDAWPALGWIGGRREPTFALYEELFFNVVIRNFSVDKDNKTQLDFKSELLAPDGKTLEQQEGLLDRPFLDKNRVILVPGFMKSGMDATTGRHTFRFIVHDKISNKTVTKDIPFEIIDADRFDLHGFKFTADSKGEILIGPNFTVGSEVFLKDSTYLPKKMDGRDLEMTITYLDEKGRVLSQKTREHFNVLSNALHAPYQYLGTMPLATNQPGTYTVRLTLTDPATKKTVTREVSYSVFSPSEK